MPSPSSGATTAGGERPRYEVADIVRAYGAVYQRTHGVSAAQAVVLRALTRCRTAALGGHIEACEACGTRRIAYNSCRNRHCPKCQGGARTKWLAAEQAVLLPVEYFHVVFTLPPKFLAGLRRLRAHDALRFAGNSLALADPATWTAWLALLRTRNWLVYAKPPFGGPDRVLKYLSRYTHRVAIANERLVFVGNGEVRFRWKDYADHHRLKLMTLAAEEFLRRFLLHVVPSGFMRIRHFGLLANRHRATKLAQCRALLGTVSPPTTPPAPPPPVAPNSTRRASSTSSVLHSGVAS